MKIRINRWVKFSIVALLYFLWVIWVGNFFLLLGLPIIFDSYITKKVNWTFWKKRGIPKGQHSKLVEWVDAVIFAVVAATFIRMFFIEAYTIPTSSMEKSLLVGDYLFVSKVSYGPKLPNTPISFPFVHHTMPWSKTQKSYSEAIQWDYKRLAGTTQVNRDDVVVFNFPEGDTVALKMQDGSYYSYIRRYGWKNVNANKQMFGEIVHRPVDKCENYIKRCIAVGGDSLYIEHGDVYVNGKKQKYIPGKQYNYQFMTNGKPLNIESLINMGITKSDISTYSNIYAMPLTEENRNKVKNIGIVTKMVQSEDTGANPDVFPFSRDYPWNQDNFGPLWIPKKGSTVTLTKKNLPIYRRVIEVYEENDLKIDGDKILINGEETTSYTFKMNYYWMMGDNRHNSLDSRYWGFVPEDHIVGKAIFIWLSLDKDKSFPSNIRFDRLFKMIR